MRRNFAIAACFNSEQLTLMRSVARHPQSGQAPDVEIPIDWRFACYAA
jgi:hypothetical protein